MSQNYQPGQLVRLARVGFSKFDASANDLYEVMRLMPADQTGEVTYRIKSVIAGERAVRKAEIRAYVSPESITSRLHSSLRILTSGVPSMLEQVFISAAGALVIFALFGLVIRS